MEIVLIVQVLCVLSDIFSPSACDVGCPGKACQEPDSRRVGWVVSDLWARQPRLKKNVFLGFRVEFLVLWLCAGFHSNTKALLFCLFSMAERRNPRNH